MGCHARPGQSYANASHNEHVDYVAALFDVIVRVQDHKGFGRMRLINDHMDRIPDNAQFHSDIKLEDVIGTKDGTHKIAKSMVEASKLVYNPDMEAISYKKKAVGVRPSSTRLKEALWQVLDPETKVEATR